MLQSNLHGCAENIKSAGDPGEEPLMPAFLEVADARVRYGNNEVLKGVNLSVKKGEFVALLGSSGCGKTTLLRAIAGFNMPSGGAIRLNGKDVTRLPPDKRGMALVFQSYALWPHMTVAQNMGYGLRIRGVAKETIKQKVDDVARLLGLDALLERKPAALSGGQRQRVALGRGLAIQPDILLLDEPLSNLDARIRLSVRHEISALQRRLGITAVHVTHDREEAMVMADRIVILNNGEIAQAGAPEEVYNHPASDFVAAFMGAENLIEVPIQIKADRIEIAAGANNKASTISAGRRNLSDGPASARFRSEAARLTKPGADPDSPTAELVLNGTVEQTTYPGGLWRHMIRVGDRHIMVDAQESHQPGANVEIRIPDHALFLFDR
ncbi:sn-glycerol-3-phosphate import ATP-binding protein ugpC [Brucella intermedia LMG 3301]|uniref:sn-glycerol-3-phosphate import ATP-binding protein ugpC n=2 Tax=Brucella intermedia TaxID=94625 RepID=C4WLH9_9HYPH|nr:sn-glycerol-3-phosphate import ATP-binding protein ugpC [Brucella intermedia LMG 3301]